MKDRICAIDTETTGLDSRSARVVELAVLPLADDFTVDQSRKPFEILINPGVRHLQELEMPSRAMLVNGLSRDVIAAEGVDSAVVVVLLRQWMKDNHIAKIEPLGQNWAFDEKMIDFLIGFDALSELFKRPARDSARVAKAINDINMLAGREKPFPSCSLQALAKQLGLNPGHAHRALDDARLCADVYRVLLEILRDHNIAYVENNIAANKRLQAEAMQFEDRIAARDKRIREQECTIAVQGDTIAGLNAALSGKPCSTTGELSPCSKCSKIVTALGQKIIAECMRNPLLTHKDYSMTREELSALLEKECKCDHSAPID